MKNVLKLAVMFVALLVSANVFAQSPEKLAKKVDKEIEMRADVMKLDSVQQNKMKVVLTTFYNDRNEAKKLEGKERGNKMKEVKMKLDTELRQICTPQQMEAWDVYQKANVKPKEKKD